MWYTNDERHHGTYSAMAHKTADEAVKCTYKDIWNVNSLTGEVAVLFTDLFGQTPPVVPRGHES